jgi:hypothetical protein
MSIVRENLTTPIFEDTAYAPAQTALPKQKFIKETGAVATAGESGYVSNYDWNQGDNYSVVRVGTVKVLAGAAVAVGADVESDGSGRAITLTTGKKNGRALTAATNANDVIVIAVP